MTLSSYIKTNLCSKEMLLEVTNKLKSWFDKLQISKNLPYDVDPSKPVFIMYEGTLGVHFTYIYQRNGFVIKAKCFSQGFVS